MDCRRPSIGLFLSLAVISLAASCSPSASLQGDTPPEILKWIKPDTDFVQALSVEPSECLADEALSDPAIQLGRAAFRSPFLLGGQAARQGLTCQACHRQGQSSTNFFVVGLSDEPGNADVTNFHFSDDLGDEVFNPSPIPSLSDDVQSVDYSPDLPDLEQLVTRLITKEFNGETPDPQIFDGLISYLRALDNEHCAFADDDYPKLQGEALLKYNVESISNMFAVLGSSDYPDVPKQFMIASLRSDIGRLYSRYPVSKDIQSGLKDLGQALNSRAGDVDETQLIAAREMWIVMTPKLEQKYSKSLYNQSFIRKWAQ